MKKESIKRILSTVIPLALVAFVVLAVIAYFNGVYEISFIERKSSKDITIQGEQTETEEEQTETEIAKETVEAGDNIKDLFNPDDIAEQTDSEKEATFPTASSLIAGGGHVTDENYNSDEACIALVDTSLLLDGQLFQSGQLRMSVYNGRFIYSDDSGKYLLDEQGNVLISALNGLSPAGFTDGNGHSVWTDGEDGFYYINEANKTLVPISVDKNLVPVNNSDSYAEYCPANKLQRYYTKKLRQRKIDSEGNDITDHVAALIESAVRYGKDIDDPEVYASLEIPYYTYEEREVILYGYVRDTGSIYISAQYYYATDFNSEGYALVADESGAMRMIDTNGRTILSLNSRVIYPQERNKRATVINYGFPDTTQDVSGMFDFENGYIRVTYTEYDYRKVDELVDEYDILVDVKGNRFEIPAGYTLEGYSEGIMLLCRDGYYGMMDLTGSWVVQPVYKYATSFIQGLAVVGNSHGLYAMIDTSGNVVLPFEYDYISLPSGGVIAAHKEKSGWYMYDIIKK